jgi:hypothetical protein
MRTIGLAAVLAVAIAGCSPVQWAGDDLHGVDGYLVGTEQACDWPPGERCELQVSAAAGELDSTTRDRVVAATVADGPTGVKRASGQIVMILEAGLARSSVVIFTFVDGTRSLIGVSCMDADYDRSCHALPDIPVPRADEPPSR